MTEWQKYHEQYEVDMERYAKETGARAFQLPSFRQWLFANGLTDTLSGQSPHGTPARALRGEMG